MTSEKSAIVVGGGIIGVTSAYTLARDGWRVTLIERNHAVGLGASFGNGRQLSYSHTSALASPTLLAHLPQLVLGHDEALRVNFSFDAQLLGWTARFLANCTTRAHRRNTRAVSMLAVRSREAMARLLAKHPLDFDRRRSGKMVLLHSGNDLRAARQMQAINAVSGIEQRLLEPEEAIREEPALAQCTDQLVGALYSPGDETGNCQAFAAALLRVLKEKFDVSFRHGEEVDGVTPSSSGAVVKLASGGEMSTDLVVIANGDRANDLAAPLGVRCPIQPMKGYSFIAPAGPEAPRRSITDPTRRIVFTNLGDEMLVAGNAELGPTDCAIEAGPLQSMIAAARSALPMAADYAKVHSGWAGYRPLTPNSQPITRMVKPGIAVNAGHGMLGWTLAMGSAERLAEIVRKAA